MVDNNRVWLWWQNRKSRLFLTGALVLVVILFLVPPYRNFDLVGGYTFLLVTLIIRVKKKYREFIRITEAPVLPFPTQEENGSSEKNSGGDHKTPIFSLPEILLKEFEYAKETADQAMDDRHTLVNYFLLSAGVVLASFGLMISAEGGAQFAYRYEVVITLSLVFNAVGWVYFMQIVRLRQAWCESARAMNHIKQVFVKNCRLDFDIAKKCFRWDFESIPKAGKKMTVFYFSALLISILNSAAIVLAGIIVIDLNLFRNSGPIPLAHFVISSGMGLFHLIFQMSMYTSLLEEAYEPKNAARQ